MQRSKVVIAPDSFKGTMSAVEVCDIIECAFREHRRQTQIVKIPVADGGEGMVDAYARVLGAVRMVAQVRDPRGKPVTAHYAMQGHTAIIEMAAASGLPLVSGHRDPMRATSFGTGQLMLDALDKGAGKILLGIGGSATNDGGIGMAAALGVRLLDEHGAEIEPYAQNLHRIDKLDISGLDQRLRDCAITIACDVDNPLCGKEGASAVFGPQKGADEAAVIALDAGLRHYGRVLERQFGVQVCDLPGAGAAGGLAVPLLAFTGCKLRSGIELMLDMVRFDDVISDAALIITGEGRIDGQSLRGKVPIGIARRAKALGVPVIALVGCIGGDIERVYDQGICAVFATNARATPLRELKRTCRDDLYNATANLLKAYNAMIAP